MFDLLFIIAAYGVFYAIEGVIMRQKRKKETKRMIDEFERRHPVKQGTDG